jgi:hypothetical protein
MLALAALVGAATPVIAAEPGPAAPKTTPGGPAMAPPPPPMPSDYSPPPPAPETAPHEVVPEITIVTKKDAIHEEYRANGRLYMIKVTPTKGKPYYLIDRDGSGQFRRSDFEPSVAIPMWVIKSW